LHRRHPVDRVVPDETKRHQPLAGPSFPQSRGGSEAEEASEEEASEEVNDMEFHGGLAPHAGNMTVDAELRTLALVTHDARNGTCESPFTSKVHTLACKTVLASTDEAKELRVADEDIDQAAPLNRGGGNTPISIQRTRNETEAGHLAVKRILSASDENAVAEAKAREDLLRCSPL